MLNTPTTESAGGGRFHCPACHVDRAYDLTVTRERRSFLGIPMGRAREVGRNVVCRDCGTRFAPDILFGDDERHAHRVEAALRQGLQGLIIRMVLQDGRVAPEEKAVLVRVHRELLGRAPDDDTLDAAIRAAAEDGRPAADFARAVAGFLNAAEKATVLRAALRVAKADRDYDPSERHLLAEIGAGLEMDHEDIQAVLEGA